MGRDGIHTTKEGRKTFAKALLSANVFGDADVPAACPDSFNTDEPPQSVGLSNLMPS